MKRKLFLFLALMLGFVSSIKADVNYTRAFSNAAWEGNSGVQKNAFPLQNSVNMGECYYTSFSTGSAMSQTVTGLPNGKYTVEVYAQAHHANISGYNPETMVNVNKLKVNSSTEALATVNNNGFVDGEPTLHTFDDVSVTDGTLTISINRDANGANWFTASVKSVVYKGTSDYADYTSLIQNPSFESDASDWDTSKSKGSNVELEFPANANFRVSGDKYAERYQPNGTVDVRQTVTAPKTGLYRVGVGAFARGSEISSAKLFANGQEVSITAINRYSVTIYVEKDADIEFGVTATGNGGGTSWFAFDDFSLEYLGTDLTYKIVNPSFTSTYTTGWTLDGTAPNAYNSTYGTYEAYHLVGGLHQNITGLPNGVYKVTMQASERVDVGSHAFNLYATTSSGTTKSTATVASHTNFNAMAQAMFEDPTYARIETYAVVTNGNLTLGHYESNNRTWPVFDNYTLTYCSADADAYTLFLTNEAPKANSNISAMAASDVKTAMSTAYSTKSVTATQENCQWITYVESSGVELKEASNLEVAADAIANVAYKETTSGSHATYVSAINDFVTSVTEATTTSDVTTAINTLKSAIKTYINNAEPLNEGESFNITCLITNPSFEYDNATGWSGTTPGFESYQNAEFFNKNFDFYQNITGLANGSYQLSVQAFCRPGDNGTTSAGAYYDYTQGINNITAELYVNSDASTISNIYAYKDNTDDAKVTGNDFHCTISPDDYWVPNNMEGAGLYFDDDAYNTNVAALVEDGNLKIGFREENKKTNQWVIFDNFRLYYYGRSKMIYYKQYLPQLEADIEENYLSNGTYDVLKSGQTERTALATANAADAEDLDTEEELQDAIDDIIEARNNFVAAKGEYDNLSAKITTANSYSNNKGEGVFQITNAAWSTLESQITTSQGVYDTGTTSKASVTTEISTLNTAINTATSTLVAPVPEKRYCIVLSNNGGWTHDGKAMTYLAKDRNNMGEYNIKYYATPNSKYAQAFILTQVEGNTYKMSQIDVDGNTRYISTGVPYSGNTGQIRTVTDVKDALVVRIIATSTENVFNIYNTEANNYIGSQDDGVYTVNSHINFTIEEASMAAAANLTVKSGKLGTFIAPFKVTLPAKVKAYSATADETGVTLKKFKNGGEDLPAGTPVIIYGDGEDTSVDFYADYSAVNGNKTVGALTGILDDTTVPKDAYVLQTKGETQAFYLLNEDAAGKLNRCYVTAEESGEARLVISFDDDDPTAINAIEAASEETEGLEDGKYLIDGKIVIVKNGVKYSANGQILK